MLFTLSAKSIAASLLSVLLLAAGESLAQEDAPTASDNDGETSTGNMTTKPPSANPRDTSRPKIDIEKRQNELLQKEIRDGELNWLEAEGEKFMSIWQADRTGKPFGALLILHGEGQSAQWPHTVHAVRNNLSLHGWAALAIDMPLLNNSHIPARGSQHSTQDKSAATSATSTAQTDSVNNENTASARMRAAMNFLNQKGQFNVVIVGHGIGALRAARYADSLKSEQNGLERSARRGAKPIRALVFVEARNTASNKEEQITDYFGDRELPILDIYYGDHFLDPLESRKRKQASVNARMTDYYQVKIMRPTETGQTFENRLTRRIRGFLGKHAKGVEVGRGR